MAFEAKIALEWSEPNEVIPELVAAAIIKAQHVNDFYELMDLLEEYNITFTAGHTYGTHDLHPESSYEEIKLAVQYTNWDSFQNDNEIIQLQDYIEEIVGKL